MTAWMYRNDRLKLALVILGILAITLILTGVPGYFFESLRE